MTKRITSLIFIAVLVSACASNKKLPTTPIKYGELKVSKVHAVYDGDTFRANIFG